MSDIGDLLHRQTRTWRPKLSLPAALALLAPESSLRAALFSLCSSGEASFCCLLHNLLPTNRMLTAQIRLRTRVMPMPTANIVVYLQARSRDAHQMWRENYQIRFSRCSACHSVGDIVFAPVVVRQALLTVESEQSWRPQRLGTHQRPKNRTQPGIWLSRKCPPLGR